MLKHAKKAIIFDLDNTIYPVAAIGPELFAGLYEMIEQDASYRGKIEDVKDAVERKPFQAVAKEFLFSAGLTFKGLKFLSDIEYTGEIHPFEDYQYTKDINCLKFLVTTGFTKLQWSKIHVMRLENDFKECFVVDPSISSQTKKDVFGEIMNKYGLMHEEVLVVGDDIHSEITAAQELSIDAVVYDYSKKYMHLSGYNVITDFAELNDFM